MDFNALKKEKPAARNKKLQEQLLNYGNNFDNLSVGDQIICIEERKNGRYGSYVGFHDGNYY